MANRHEYALEFNLPLALILEALGLYSTNLTGIIGKVFSDCRVPDRLNLLIGLGPFSHDFGGPEFFTTMDKVYL